MPKKGSICDTITRQDLKSMPMIEISRKYGIKHNTLIMWAKKKKIEFVPFTHQTNYDHISISEDGLFRSNGELIKVEDGIFTLRSKLGYNRDQFGILFGKSGRTVESWEQGRSKPCKSDLEHMKSIFEELIKK